MEVSPPKVLLVLAVSCLAMASRVGGGGVAVSSRAAHSHSGGRQQLKLMGMGMGERRDERGDGGMLSGMALHLRGGGAARKRGKVGDLGDDGGSAEDGIAGNVEKADGQAGASPSRIGAGEDLEDTVMKAVGNKRPILLSPGRYEAEGGIVLSARQRMVIASTEGPARKGDLHLVGQWLFQEESHGAICDGARISFKAPEESDVCMEAEGGPWYFEVI
jgi:hypothetical protein